MPNEEISVKKADIEPTLAPDTVAINSAVLANALVHDQATTLKLMSEQASQVKIEDIIIDAIGRVVVKNAEWVNLVKEKAVQELDDTNVGACGKANAYKCSGVIEEQ